MRISVKLAPTFDYPELEKFWRTADGLGFEAIWDYDHFYGLVETPGRRTKGGPPWRPWPWWSVRPGSVAWSPA